MAAARILEFFSAIMSTILEWRPLWISVRRLPAAPPPAADIEMGERINSRFGLAQTDLNWSKLVVAFCFASALEIAHYSQSHRVLASSYFLLCLAISVSFSCIFVAKFTPGSSRFAVAAQVLEHVGVLLAVTAFFMAITSPFPLSLKLTIWAIYALSLLAILFSALF